MSVPTFTSVPGPLVDVDDPCQLFNSFMTDDLIEMIVTETNRYAAICLESESKSSVWTTSVDEIRAFLGFCILMGMNRLPATSDYWSTDSIISQWPLEYLVQGSRKLRNTSTSWIIVRFLQEERRDITGWLRSNL